MNGPNAQRMTIPQHRLRAEPLVIGLSLATGISALLPIGFVYLTWFALAAHLLFFCRPAIDWGTLKSWSPLIALILAPALLATLSTAIHGMHEQTASRLFHAYRNAFVIGLALALTQIHRVWIWRGLLGSSFAALLVIITHNFVLPLPLHHPFQDLLQVSGNAGSQKMIMLATIAGMLFWMFLQTIRRPLKWLYFGAWAIITATVAWHSISRNAYLLLLVLPGAALVYRYRQPKTLLLAVFMAVSIAGTIWTASDSVRARTEQAIQELESYSTTGNYSGSANVRARMMIEAAHQMIENPLTGTGTGTWLEHWRHVARDVPHMAETNNPHNDYLLAGMENGLPGMLSLALLMSTFLYINWKANDQWGGLAFVTTASVAITALVNAPFRDAVMGMALIWIMAAFTRLPEQQKV